MNIDAINAMVGTDWVYGVNDCWAVFRKASRDVFGVDVPGVEIPEQSDQALNALLFDQHAGQPQWCRVTGPEPGCAVLFRNAKGNAMHIGLYVEEGNVLHCMGHPDRPGRTAYDNLRMLRRLFKRVEFYRYVPDSRH